MIDQFKNLKRYSFLLQELVKKGIKLKYRRSYLGILWSMLEPLLYMIVLTIVFGTLLGHDEKSYPVYILSGRLLYSFFNGATKSCLTSIRKNAGMIKKVYVPKYIYPMSCVLIDFAIFLLSLPVLFVVSLVLGVYPSVSTLFCIIPLLNLLMLTYGVGMILATVGVFFRDMEYIWSVATTLIMYLSAIFYKPKRIFKHGGMAVYMLKVNPLFDIIDNFRSGIFGESINWHYTLYSTVFAVVSLIIGLFVFKKRQDDFILHL